MQTVFQKKKSGGKEEVRAELATYASLAFSHYTKNLLRTGP
jgi:hypothetical protein